MPIIGRAAASEASCRMSVSTPAGSTSMPRPQRPSERFLDLGPVVANQRFDQRQTRLPAAAKRARCGAAAGTGSVAIVEADQPALPADPGVDELLDLGPAEGLEKMPCATSSASESTAIQSVAARASRLVSCHARSGSSAKARSQRLLAEAR